jgi:predicted O-linked N-acetylglucosamine transferase (SPINDLY family)
MPHYHEKFVRMPASYQPNDRGHRSLPPALSRAELGLPDDKFVFATFNSNRKITRQNLDLWAEILCRVPDSVLWAMIYHDIGRANFRDYLAGRGSRGNWHGRYRDRSSPRAPNPAPGKESPPRDRGSGG